MAAPSLARAPVWERTARDGGTAALDGQRQHRLAGGGGVAGGAGERAAVTEVLDVQRDHLGGLMAGEVPDQLGGVHVGLVAQRGERD